ncbi:MAG: TIGR00341 family protein [Patescibacteria group bacterium]
MEIAHKTIKEKLSFFRITEERQKKVYQQIRENAKADFDFYTLLVVSTVIITLGLYINSAAVIIGGMLIAPLVWPILALSLSIVKGHSSLFGTSILTLLKSTLIILLVSSIVGLITPEINLENQEILSRTQPQLFELFVAIASGFIGAFVVTYPKLGEAMAGVVVAAALVPPLAAMGLLMTSIDFAAAGGAFLLYTSNLIAITLSATVTFFLARFRGPATAEAQELQKSNIRWSIVFLVVISIPLLIITVDSVRIQQQRNLVEEVLLAKVDAIDIQEISIDETGEVARVNVTVRSPYTLYTYQVEELTDIISRELGGSVLLQISVIPVIEAGKILPPNGALLQQQNDVMPVDSDSSNSE